MSRQRVARDLEPSPRPEVKITQLGHMAKEKLPVDKKNPNDQLTELQNVLDKSVRSV